MRYILKISYDGTNYSGFQKQKDKVTIQEIIEKVLSQIFRTDIVIVASGRTDAGVSAIEQVCHVDIDEEFDTKKILGYANALLPKDIRFLSLTKTEKDFHARYTAKRKTYEYMFYIGMEDIPVYDKFACHIGYNIDRHRTRIKKLPRFFEDGRFYPVFKHFITKKVWNEY